MTDLSPGARTVKLHMPESAKRHEHTHDAVFFETIASVLAAKFGANFGNNISQGDAGINVQFFTRGPNIIMTLRRAKGRNAGLVLVLQKGGIILLHATAARDVNKFKVGVGRQSQEMAPRELRETVLRQISIHSQ